MTFEYINIRPQDLELPSDAGVSPEEFQATRISFLQITDYNWIAQGFDAGRHLVHKVHQMGGISVVQEQWATTHKMADLYLFGNRPQDKKVKWPIVGVMFLELSAWRRVTRVGGHHTREIVL
jgi:hypothetical protein